MSTETASTVSPSTSFRLSLQQSSPVTTEEEDTWSRSSSSNTPSSDDKDTGGHRQQHRRRRPQRQLRSHKSTRNLPLALFDSSSPPTTKSVPSGKVSSDTSAAAVAGSVLNGISVGNSKSSIMDHSASPVIVENGMATSSIDRRRNDNTLQDVGNDDDDDEDDATNHSGSTRFRPGTTKIRWFQKVFIASVAAVGLLCSLSTFFVLRQAEQDQYEEELEEASAVLYSTIHSLTDTVLGTLITISTAIASHNIDINATYPYVQIPHFSQRTDEILRHVPSSSSAGAEVVYAPLVPRALREDYELWTTQNEQLIIDGTGQSTRIGTSASSGRITPYIFRREYTVDNNGNTEWAPVPDDGGIDPYFVPILETNPLQTRLVNENLYHTPNFQRYLNHILRDKQQSIVTLQQSQEQLQQQKSTVGSGDSEGSLGLDLQLVFVSPVLRRFASSQYQQQQESSAQTDTNPVAALSILRLRWTLFLGAVIRQESSGLIRNLDIEVQDSCSTNYRYHFRVDSAGQVQPRAISTDQGLSVPAGDEASQTFLLKADTSGVDIDNVDEDYCPIIIAVHSADAFRGNYITSQPVIFSIVVAVLFGILLILFFKYDRLYRRQQDQVVKSAKQSHDLVSSLFPAQFRDRLLFNQGRKNSQRSVAASPESHPDRQRPQMHRGEDPTGHLPSENALSAEPDGPKLQVNKPIAELFIKCTVMFADIAGFTAWSSQREPAEVFTLLESVYSAFDAIAKRQRIFKVETIGDCYVATAGLPERREDHAEAMAKFANACRRRMNQVVRKLEVILGPDTADLSMRFGLHSGPVTAGVLRGDKSRFQLFGDTVNTACRIESTGARDRIHLSEETANILIARGKRDWVSPRETLVEVKGKGMMQTWWLIHDQTDIEDAASKMSIRTGKNSVVSNDDELRSHGTEQITFEHMDDDYYNASSSSCSSSSSSSSDSSSSLRSDDGIDEKTLRLIEWNVDIMAQQLKKITAMRDQKSQLLTTEDVDELTIEVEGEMVLDEVREIINLSTQKKQYKRDPDEIDLGEAVVDQLQEYVREISKMYRDNPFHSFAHASHVTQSVAKLLARVVTPDSIDYEVMCYKKQAEAQLHEYTYGITSDPLIHFACIFSALIHDVDHSGLPNANLIKCNKELADRYKNKSVAEQNSVDLSWDLLMEPRFVDLRGCIYRDQEEMDRFRQLVVNSVMATDIADKELGALRRKRWERAFDMNEQSNDTLELQRDSVNRKATIVIEHLIQASDVSHTMQHWHVYRKWNEKLFHEMYKAYIEGKSDKDPSIGWYEGELGFFDFYIIPLAKKLKECGCFGVSSDEYLNYATANRSEWQLKGWEIVRGYMTKYRHTMPDATRSPDRRGQTQSLGSQDLVKFLMAGHNSNSNA